MLKASPSALKWFEQKTGKTLVEYLLELFRDSPEVPSLEDFPDDHPSIDDLIRTLENRIQSDQTRRKPIRDFSILIDDRWMTEELGEEDVETRIKLSKKYCMEQFQVHRLLQEMMP
jgi:hypothetical protein